MTHASLTRRSSSRRLGKGRLAGCCEVLESRALLTADLTASFASITPQVVNGTRDQIALDVTNLGTTRVNGAVAIQIYAIPEGESFSTATARLLTTARPALHLGAGGKQTVSVNVPISAAMAAGSYQLVAVVDSGRRVKEVDETNNTVISAAFDVTQSNVDLTSRIVLNRTPTLIAGQRVTTVARVTVTNSDLSTNRVALNTRSTFQIVARPVGALDDTNDVILATSTIPVGNLAPGASRTVLVPVHFPATMTEGDINLLVDADTNGALAETDELNNMGFLADTLTVLPESTVVPSPVTGGVSSLPVGTSPSIVTLTPTIIPTPTSGSLVIQPVNQSLTLVNSQFPTQTFDNSISGLMPTNLNLFPTNNSLSPTLTSSLNLGGTTAISPVIITPSV